MLTGKSSRLHALRATAALALVLLLTGCGRSITSTPGDAPNLVEWVAQVRARPAPPLDPIPVIKPFESFQFDGRGFMLADVIAFIAAHKGNALLQPLAAV